MSSVWGKLQVIKTEITVTDPARYAGKTDQQIADELNDPTKSNAPDREEISGSDLFEAIVSSEYAGLATAVRERVQIVVGLGDNIKVGPTSKARAWLLDAFAVGSATRTNLIALVSNQKQSRAFELGIFDRVMEAHVVAAKAL